MSRIHASVLCSVSDVCVISKEFPFSFTAFAIQSVQFRWEMCFIIWKCFSSFYLLYDGNWLQSETLEYLPKDFQQCQTNDENLYHQHAGDGWYDGPGLFRNILGIFKLINVKMSKVIFYSSLFVSKYPSHLRLGPKTALPLICNT